MIDGAEARENIENNYTKIIQNLFNFCSHNVL